MSFLATKLGAVDTAKFGAGQRVLTFQGTGTLQTWLEPGNLNDLVSSSLTANGWGVAGVQIVNGHDLSTLIIVPMAGALPTWQYFIKISIYANPGDSTERIRMGVNGVLAQWFQNLNISLVGSDVETDSPSGSVSIKSSGEIPTFLEGIFGRGSTADQLISTGGKTLGLSLGTIITFGLGFLLVGAILNKRK